MYKYSEKDKSIIKSRTTNLKIKLSEDSMDNFRGGV